MIRKILPFAIAILVSASFVSCDLLEYCIDCGKEKSECTCSVECVYCGSDSCNGECQTCPEGCTTPYCEGECVNDGDDSDDSDDSVTTDNYPFAPEKITAAADVVITELTKQYGSQKSVCNFGVRNMFNTFFITNELNNMLANYMAKHWADTPEKWEEVSVNEVQALANAGWFVVSGWINTGGSGHVNVIVPGDGSAKGTWNGAYGSIPVAMDSGYNMRKTSIGLNYCYGRDKQAAVKFYKYK